MKQKILEKLKAVQLTHGKDVSLKTLEAQAETLSIFIADDEALEKLNAESIISNLQGNINHTASEAARLAAEKAKEVETPPTPTPTPDEKPMNITPEQMAKMIADGIAAGMTDIRSELDGMKQNNIKEGIINQTREKIQEYNLSEAELTQSDYIFNKLIDGEVKDVESLIKAWETEYNQFRSITGQGSVVLKTPDAGDSDEEDPFVTTIRAERADADARRKAAADRLK